MKTAATVLQELMVSLGNTPEYECISQTGPQHCSMFEFKCLAHGHMVTAMARTKKEAKQEAARLMLLQLARSGLAVPPPYGLHEAQMPSTSAQLPPTSTASGTPPPDQLHGSRSYVALLKELCEEFRLPAPQFELCSDTGPAHERRFGVRARVGQHARLAVAGTKKAAKQRAAELVYGYLRRNLARLTCDFVEEDALIRATAKAMDKYNEVREDMPWRPDLSQKISDYHLAFKDIEEGRRAAALAALEPPEAPGRERGLGRAASPERALAAAADALALPLAGAQLPAAGAPLALLLLERTAPPLVFAGRGPRAAAAAAAAAAAVDYLRLALRQ